MYLIVLSKVVAADTLLGNGVGGRMATAHHYNIILVCYWLTYVLQFYCNTNTVMWDPTGNENKDRNVVI